MGGICRASLSMVTDQELRHLCLLAAASGLVKYPMTDGPSARAVQHSTKCAMYMVLAFSLRRRNLARRDLRTAPDNPNTPNSSRLRFGAYNAAAFRSQIRKHLSIASSTIPHRQGCFSITYM